MNLQPSIGDLTPGIYRHYKGKDYFVFQLAKHSETGESLVVYRCLYGDYSWWVRPQSLFEENVEVAGETIARFRLQRSLAPEQMQPYLAPWPEVL